MRSRSGKTATIPQQRWLAYAAAGVATAAATAPAAEAEIHYSGPVHLHMDGHNSRSIFRLEMPPYAHLEIWRGQNFSGPGEYDFLIVSASKVGAVRVSGFPNYIAKLPPGINVSSGEFFGGIPAWLIGFSSGNFRQRGVGFVGFKFDRGSGVQYGWARIRTNRGGANNVLTVVDYAWADPGEPILTGQMEETANAKQSAGAPSLGMLAQGATGLTALPSRRGK